MSTDHKASEPRPSPQEIPNVPHPAPEIEPKPAPQPEIDPSHQPQPEIPNLPPEPNAPFEPQPLEIEPDTAQPEIEPPGEAEIMPPASPDT